MADYRTEDRPKETRHDTTVIHTSEGGGGAGAWVVALIVIVLLAFAAFYIYSNDILGSGTSVDVQIEQPTDGNAGTEGAPAGQATGEEQAPSGSEQAPAQQ